MVIAIHTEIFNKDRSLAGHITWIEDGDKHTVHSHIPEEKLNRTQSFPYEAHAAARYAVMVQKVKAVAQRHEKKQKHLS